PARCGAAGTGRDRRRFPSGRSIGFPRAGRLRTSAFFLQPWIAPARTSRRVVVQYINTTGLSPGGAKLYPGFPPVFPSEQSNAMTNAVEIHHVTKTFGRHTAVDDLSLAVP